MPSTTIKGRNVPIEIWAPIEEVDTQVINQLKNVAALPWVAHHVAVMPDVHLGKGATVGSVIAMRGAVAPAAVGVDIGCGMAAVRTSLRAADLPDDLRSVRLAIEDAIPVGRMSHERAAWQQAPDPLRAAGQALMDRYAALDGPVHMGTVACQLGTLGGGNHFIEICLDTDQAVWLMLHSGSRNVGKVLADHHTDIARRLKHNEALEDRDLAVFLSGTKPFDAYRRDLFWAQEYARVNRQMMLHLLEDVVRRVWPRVTFADPISCHHNYVAEEVHFGDDLLVTRKGAIRAGLGEMGIIPGSMGTKSYIVRGLGNARAFQSASHGAGRRMSRSEARRRFNLRDLADQTRRRRVPEGPGRHRRGAQGLQEHRQRDEAAAGSGRDRRRAQTDRLREGLKFSPSVALRQVRGGSSPSSTPSRSRSMPMRRPLPGGTAVKVSAPHRGPARAGRRRTRGRWRARSGMKRPAGRVVQEPDRLAARLAVDHQIALAGRRARLEQIDARRDVVARPAGQRRPAGRRWAPGSSRTPS